MKSHKEKIGMPINLLHSLSTNKAPIFIDWPFLIPKLVYIVKLPPPPNFILATALNTPLKNLEISDRNRKNYNKRSRFVFGRKCSNNRFLRSNGRVGLTNSRKFFYFKNIIVVQNRIPLNESQRKTEGQGSEVGASKLFANRKFKQIAVTRYLSCE